MWLFAILLAPCMAAPALVLRLSGLALPNSASSAQRRALLLLTPCLLVIVRCFPGRTVETNLHLDFQKAHCLSHGMSSWEAQGNTG